MGRDKASELLPGNTNLEEGGLIRSSKGRRLRGEAEEFDKNKKFDGKDPRKPRVAWTVEDSSPDLSDQDVTLEENDSSTETIVPGEPKEVGQTGNDAVSSADIHHGRGSFRSRELNSDGVRDPEENPVASIRSLRAHIEEQVKQLTQQLTKNQKIEFEVDGQPLMTAISLALARARTISDEYFQAGRMKVQGNGRKKQVQQVLQATLDELKEYHEQITFALIQDAEAKLGMATSPRPVVVEGELPSLPNTDEGVDLKIRDKGEDAGLESTPYLKEIFGDRISKEEQIVWEKYFLDEVKTYRRKMRAWFKKEAVPHKEALMLLIKFVPDFLEELCVKSLRESGHDLSDEEKKKLMEKFGAYIYGEK